MQRPGLVITDNTVFAGFGGICDHPSYRGWVTGVPENGTSFAPTLWTTTNLGDANGEGAVWMSDAPIVSDTPGQLLITTGNSDGSKSTDPGPGSGTAIPVGLASSVVRLTFNPGTHTLAATDFFSPYDNQYLSTQDLDVGSGGVTPLPCPATCTSNVWGTTGAENVGITPSKNGSIYVLNRNFLGGMSQGPGGSDGVPQRIDVNGRGFWNTFAPWPGDATTPPNGGLVYIVEGVNPNNGTAGALTAFQDNNSGTEPVFTQAGQASNPNPFGYGSSSPIVTSNGSTAGSGIVWDVYVSDSHGDGATLYAYNALPSGGHLTQIKGFGLSVNGVKFARPYANNNHIYVGAQGAVFGFG